MNLPAPSTTPACQPARARWGANMVRVERERRIERFAYAFGEPFGEGDHGVQRLRVTAHRVRQLHVRFGAAGVALHSAFGGCYRALEDGSAVVLVGHTVEAVDRQRVGGERQSRRVAERLAGGRGVEETPFRPGGLRFLQGLRRGGEAAAGQPAGDNEEKRRPRSFHDAPPPVTASASISTVSSGRTSALTSTSVEAGRLSPK